MKREIKFRAWDKKSKVIRNVIDLKFKSENYYTMLSDPTDNAPNNWTLRKEEDVILLQYTGLKDKNGVEIYEGDILKEEAPRGNKYKVWREKGGLVINQFSDDFKKPIDKISFWEGLSDMQTVSFVEGNLEIIGNIYSNPELIQAKN